MTQPNPSTAMARVIADELVRQGVDYAVISPGSRSAALALAFDEHPGVATTVVLDERSAGFHAVGRAKALGRPVAVVVTSGTAVANLFPAVVEADLSMTPIVLLTADRPPELLDVGANQTIDQVGIFGARVRWFAQVPPPDGTDQARVWRSVLSQAMAKGRGHGSSPGPVHLNVAFREPTVPVSDDGRSRSEPWPHSIEGRPGSGPWQESGRALPGAVEISLPSSSRGLIVAGEGDYDGGALLEMAAEVAWPVLATALSGVRGGEVVTTYHHLLVDGVPPSLEPDLVVVVGRSGPSDRLATLYRLDIPTVHVDRWGTWYDPWRQATHLLQADPVAVLSTLRGGERPGWRDDWLEADRRMRAGLDEVLAGSNRPSGPRVARALGSVRADRLVVASSLPIRDVDAHAGHTAPVVANRGASGIDGFVSTSIGAASAGGKTLAMAGDLSLLHDLTGFLAEGDHDLVIVAVDNGGGGLFDLLPQAEHAPGYERLFYAPHGKDLVEVAGGLGVPSAVVEDATDLAAAAASRLGAGGTHLLMVPVERSEDLEVRRRLDQEARSVIGSLG